MLKSLLLIFSVSLVFSCNSPKKVNQKNKTTSLGIQSAKKETIIATAMQYLGVAHKYGGTTTSGLDCSGLIYSVFKEHHIALPRSSYEQATKGTPVLLENIQEGDLLFFKTSKKRANSKINHVGLVTEVKEGNVFFIHSTTSRGVVISSLTENYWQRTFIEARRFL